MSEHQWQRSTLGHGEQMCAKCGITDREAAVLGNLSTCTRADPVATPSEDVGLIERLRSTAQLPVCPFDRRSPDYWTAPDDKPCVVCGGVNEEGAPDLCRGADTRIMEEAAASLASKDEEIRRKDAALRAVKLQALNAAYNLSQGKSVSQDDIIRAFHAIADTTINSAAYRAAMDIAQHLRGLADLDVSRGGGG